MRLFDSENTLVSCFHSIAWKRETKGNETGNGQETRAVSYGKNGNGHFREDGNEGLFLVGPRFHVGSMFPESRRRVIPCG